MKQKPSHLLLCFSVLFTLYSFEGTNENQTAVENKKDFSKEEIVKLIQKTLAENDELKLQINRLIGTNIQLQNQLEKSERFKEFGVGGKESYLTLRDECEAEKEKLLSADDKIQRDRFKKMLKECDSTIHHKEMMMYKFKKKAEQSEHELELCNKEIMTLDDGKKRDPFSIKSKTVLKELNYILQDIQTENQFTSNKDDLNDQSILALLRLIKEKLKKIVN